jgi:amino acid transporter
MNGLPATAPDRVTGTPGLVRALGPWLATAVVVGTVIGSGVFLKPHDIAKHVPYTGLVALAWLLVGLLAMCGSLAYAEVVTLYPRSGGNYVFLREGYGRFASFLWGWVEFWIIRGASIAALATVFARFLQTFLAETAGAGVGQLLGFWPQRVVTVAVIMALALVNVRGVHWGGVLQLLITSVKVATLVSILLLPFVILLCVAPDSSRGPLPSTDHLWPLWPDEWGWSLLSGFGAGLVGCLWAYHGWMNIAVAAEEVRHPQRNLPLALIAGTGLVILLYLGANVAYCLVFSQAELAEEANANVVAVFAREVLRPVGLAGAGAAAASAAVMCSVFGALNGILLTAPRLLYAMGEDRLAPRVLGAVHARYHTPALAILLMAGWACGLVLATAVLTALDLLPPDADPFDLLTNFVIFGSVVFETLALSTIFLFRLRRPDVERPYRCIGYPVTPALYILVMALVLVNMFVAQWREALTGAVFVAVGVGVYVLFLRGATGVPGSPKG